MVDHRGIRSFRRIERRVQMEIFRKIKMRRESDGDAKGIVLCAPCVLFRLMLVAFLLWLSCASASEESEPAKLKVSGYGLLDNLELKKLIKTFDEKNKQRE